MAATPVLPLKELLVTTANFTGLYTMFYRKDTNHLQSKNFRFHGSLQAARERAIKHCDIIGGKHMFTQPLISDLDKEEAFILDAGKKPLSMETGGEKIL